MLEPGIDFWVAAGKYRVRVMRKGITYKIGLFETIEGAVEAKHTFLAEYALREDQSEAVPMYSREWFNREHKKQVDKFRTLYSTPTKGFPHFIVVPNNANTGYEQSTSHMRLKQVIQNDGYDD